VACLHESQALAFVAGKLDAAGRDGVEDHVDECAACRQLLANLVRSAPTHDIGTDPTLGSGPDVIGVVETERAPSSPTRAVKESTWEPGTRVGRYVVLARIGRGGMGAVYRAEDVELGRPVALKRLHADADAESRARLLREARAAAQLQHPNVVTVHEVGEDAGTPYLAMELVDGVTLGAWLRAQPRSWREIVDVVAQAGRGLAAAHERGLVHRDFKPDNVLVDRRGRAHVADFGLARAHDAPSDASKPSAHDARLARLTATGSLAGTPAYMAPELVEGGAPDARSDQYAFAVTLFEALRGQHPFAGETAARLWVEMAEGRIRPGGRPIPAWLDRHVRRGLEVAPAKRWPDLASFVAAIETPSRRPVWLVAGAGAAAIAAAVAIVALRQPAATGPSCDDLANEYQPAVTPADLARAIRDPQQLELAVQAIERFTGAYRAGVRDSCRATRAGTQSTAIGDKRSACLEMAKRRAWFVVSGITTGVDSRPGLATLLEELPDVGACGDPEWLDRAAPLPVAQADRDALYLAEADLLRASKLRDDGKLADAERLVDGVSTTAKRLGDRSLDARANLFASELARDRGDIAKAGAEAVEAWSAASAHGDMDLTLRAQLAVLGTDPDRSSMSSFAGLGEVPASPNGARLLVTYGDALMTAGKLADGEQAYRRAQAIREQTLPPEHVDRALGLQRIGAALAVQKRPLEARPLLQQASLVIERAFPPLRREAIDGLRYLAMVEDELGHHDRALELQREVLRRRTTVLGADAGLTLEARADVAKSLCALGYDAECVGELQAVIAGFIAKYGDRVANTAHVRVTLANKLISLGRFAEADDALAKAVATLVKTRGADSPYTMVGEYAQVRSWLERPTPIELVEATRQLDRIEPVFAKLFGASSHAIAAMQASRARIAFAKGDAAGADAFLARALAMLGDDKRADRAELALLRARVLWKLGKRDAATASAEAAAVDYEAAGGAWPAYATVARAWAAKPTAAAPAPASPAAPAATAAPAPAAEVAATGPCARASALIDELWPAERASAESWYRRAYDEDEPRVTRVLAVIDRWVADWRTAVRAACTAQRGGDELAAKRASCLARLGAAASARISLVANASARAIVDRASLPELATCADPARLRAESVPASPAARQAVVGGERALEHARFMHEVGMSGTATRHIAWARDRLREHADPLLAAGIAELDEIVTRAIEDKRAAKDAARARPAAPPK